MKRPVSLKSRRQLILFKQHFFLTMKYRIYSITLLVILAFYIVRPVLPYIEYAINKDYIAQNLCINRDNPHSCCQGKCYLEKQLKKSSDSPSDPKDKNTSKKVQNEDVKEFLNSHISIPKVFGSRINYQVNPKTPITTRYLSAIFIPPKIEFFL